MHCTGLPGVGTCSLEACSYRLLLAGLREASLLCGAAGLLIKEDGEASLRGPLGLAIRFQGSLVSQHFTAGYRLGGLVAEASPSRAGDPGSLPAPRSPLPTQPLPALATLPLPSSPFVTLSNTSDLKINTLVATFPGVIGSVLGLVGPVSIHRECVREQV